MDEVTRLLEPDWRSNSGETEAIAVERAREAFYAAAAPTLVDLMKVAQAGRPTRVELQQPEREPVDQTLPPEELLAALEALQDEVDGLVQESIGVKLAMKSAFLDIQVAPTPKDAMDAYALFVEGYQGLNELGLDAGPEIEILRVEILRALRVCWTGWRWRFRVRSSPRGPLQHRLHPSLALQPQPRPQS